MLNQFGKRIWSNVTNPHITAERPYVWVDFLTIVNEKKGREVICQTEFSTFDFTGWREWSREEYDAAKVIAD